MPMMHLANLNGVPVHFEPWFLTSLLEQSSTARVLLCFSPFSIHFTLSLNTHM